MYILNDILSCDQFRVDNEFVEGWGCHDGMQSSCFQRKKSASKEFVGTKIKCWKIK